MYSKLSGFIIRQRTHALLHELMYPTIALCFAGFLAYEMYVAYQTKVILDVEREKKQVSSESLAAIYASQPVTDEDLRQYAYVYAAQIPENEDVFSVTSAVDEMIQLTGLSLVNFDPPLLDPALSAKNAPSQSKLTLSGTKEQFDRFFSLYHFATSRFMTVDHIRVDSAGSNLKASLTLNFFTAPIYRDPAQLVTFTSAHKMQFDQIKDEIPLSAFLTTSEATSVEPYETTKPF